MKRLKQFLRAVTLLAVLSFGWVTASVLAGNYDLAQHGIFPLFTCCLLILLLMKHKEVKEAKDEYS